MKIEIGERIQIQNAETAQWFYVNITDIFAYKGHSICYGVKLANEIYIPAVSGRVKVPAGPTCFPWLTDPIAERIEVMTQMLAGHPWWIVESYKEAYRRALSRVRGHGPAPATKGVPLLNMRRVDGFGKAGPGKDAMLDRTARLVDIYVHWQQTGKILDDYNKALGGNRRAREKRWEARDGDGLRLPQGNQWPVGWDGPHE